MHSGAATILLHGPNMHILPAHQVAFGLRSVPRLYAFLLGSGMSRAAGVPTGWDVLLDLIRRHAETVGESEQVRPDPSGWFKRTYGVEPSYSEVMERLAPTSVLQRGLLEPFFTKAGDGGGDRVEFPPGEAHRALARLVKLGAVRVIITTNFDRLIESALRDAGVVHVDVVSSDDDAKSARPFHQSECFLLKLHGDWRDSRIRNARSELSEYPRALAKLLRRILSEHVLVICGWSAEDDIALRQNVSRYARRGPLCWVDPSPREKAQALIRQLSAVHAKAPAEQFFAEVEAAYTILEKHEPWTPISPAVMASRARRLIDARQIAALDELFDETAMHVVEWVEHRLELARDVDGVKARATLDACERQVEPLLRLVIEATRYEPDAARVRRMLSRLLRAAEKRAGPRRDGPLWWLAVHPAALVAYSFGVVCAAQDRWEVVVDALRTAGSGTLPLELRLTEAPKQFTATLVYPGFGMRGGAEELIRFTDTIANRLFPMFEAIVPRRLEFDQYFDRFEVVFAIVEIDEDRVWAPRCLCRRDVPALGLSESTERETIDQWLLPALSAGEKKSSPELVRILGAGSDTRARLKYERLIKELEHAKLRKTAGS